MALFADFSGNLMMLFVLFGLYKLIQWSVQGAASTAGKTVLQKILEGFFKK